MRTQNNRWLLISILVFFGLSLFQQCAWFHKPTTEPELIKPRPVGGYETLSNAIHYPRSLREQGVEGQVSINVLVSQEGLVKETRIAESLHPELDQIVTNAVVRTRFEPALRRGKPESVWISIPFVFSLSDWSMKSTPFSTFEMVLRPSPSYKNFDAEIHVRLKDDIELPLRMECLLPLNYEKSWVKTPDGRVTASSTVRDDTGDWLLFQASEREIVFGFSTKQLEALKQNHFQYKFAMNHALPEWKLAVLSDNPTLRFTQDPDRITRLEDGTLKAEYDMKNLEPYEFSYLEIKLQI